MFEGVERFLVRRALWRSLRRLAPSRFAYGPTNDFYVPVAYLQDDPEGILIEELRGSVAIGHKWDGQRYEIPSEIHLADQTGLRIEITHFAGWQQITYNSVFDFWRGEMLRLQSWLRTFDRLAQAHFNYRTKFRHDRIYLLKKLVEDRIASEAATEMISVSEPEYASRLELFSRVYGQRVFGHPSYKEQSARFSLLLQSLAESGDLERTGRSRYRLSPKALTTIADYEQSERVNQDSAKHNRRITVLTIVLAFAAIAQSLLAVIALD